MNKAIFIDRDGVINIEKNYLHKAEDFEFIDGVFDTLKASTENGFKNIIITNQSGIARGYYSEDEYQNLTSWMIDEFGKNDVEIAKVYHCPHLDDSKCECRKPQPGMILKAKEEFALDLANSWLIGDKESDIEAGLKAGVGRLVLVRSGHEVDEKNTKAHAVVDSIANLSDMIGGVK